MRLPDLEQTKKMVDMYLESGFNYFDTAYVYGGSEELLKTTLVKRHPRDSYMLANKIPPWEVRKPQDRDKLLEKSLKRCGVDYIDFYLIHSLDDNREKSTEDAGMFEWAFQQKKRGVVKHVGFSFHGTTPYLERLLMRHPDVEFVQLQLNYMDVLRGQAGQWQALALKYNKPIIVMEPIRGGSLAKLPASAEALLKAHDPNRSAASWAMQYAANLEGVTSVLSGMSTLEHVQDNLETFKNLKPLTPAEYDLLDKVLNETAKVSGIACTACKYCHEHCPQKIDIATSFALYNEHKRGGAMWNLSMMYDTMAVKPNRCTGCSLCLEHCPQKINIPEGLNKVARVYS